MRLLLEAGADASLRDGKGRTALDLARENRQVGVVTLLEFLAERERREALLSAAKEGDVAAVKKAVRDGASPDAKDDAKG